MCLTCAGTDSEGGRQGGGGSDRDARGVPEFVAAVNRAVSRCHHDQAMTSTTTSDSDLPAALGKVLHSIPSLYFIIVVYFLFFMEFSVDFT